jgi:tetratricopeptide (TPR) repeat protein
MGAPMMLPPHLIQQVKDGKCVLVLGAGASIGAKHPQNIRIPLGNDLSKRLSQQFLGGQFSDQTLSFVAELAQSEADLITVQLFIKDLFEPFSPADFHLLLNEFNWYGLATVNYDLIVERAFAKNALRRIQPVISNKDRLEDLRRSAKDLLYLKLHGCVTRANDPDLPLILTPDQYVQYRRNRSRLFEVLEGWARELTLVFVGMTVADYDLRTVLLELSANDISRPRFYFVTPDAPPAMVRFWESKKITILAGTFEEFLKELNSSVTGLARAVPVALPNLPVFARFKHPQPTLTESTRLALESDLDFVRPDLGAPIINPRDFYRGYTGAWSAIQQNLDCPRELTEQILLDYFVDDRDPTETGLILIRAEAGAGKSVFLRRLAWDAACKLNRLCLFSKANVGLSADSLSELADELQERIYLFVDDPADCATDLERLLERARKLKFPLTVVVAERSNEWNVACENLGSFLIDSFELPYLNDKEIMLLLALLEKHDSLFTLEGKPRSEQKMSFEKQAGRQLLVALHEATLGKPFEEIIQNEFGAIIPQAAQDMYLTICTLNRTGTPVRAGLISRVHGISFSNFEKQFFKPLEHVVFTDMGRRGYDYEYRARHPHIAEIVFRRILNSAEKRFEAFTRIISSILVSYETDRTSLQEITKAKLLRELFPDYRMVRDIFKLAEERAPDDGHILLQHAIFEMRRESANLDEAADLLAKSQKLIPRNPIVIHSFAELEIERASQANESIVREKHLQRAEELVEPMLGKMATASHGYHTAFKAAHLRLKLALRAEESAISDPAIENLIRAAESRLADGLQQFPEDEYLLMAESELAQTLKDSRRALAALRVSVAAGTRSPHTVGRLAKLLMANGQHDEAGAILAKSLEADPFQKKLNFLFGMLQFEKHGDPLVIEKHFRRAFTEGDRNFEAQLYYARQLYVNGKVNDARSVFDQLKRERINPKIRYAPRLPWKENGTTKIFSGKIHRVEFAYALVERDTDGDIIIARRKSAAHDEALKMARGTRVNFTVAFNFEGPVLESLIAETTR